MDFGRLANIEHVDFTLKADPESNHKTFESLKTQHQENKTLYIGASKYAVQEWVGHYYPLKAKSKDFLHYCAEQFNSNEVNTTFYGIPDGSTMLKWYDQTREDFKFCIKVFQFISRSRNMGEGTPYLQKFIESTELLADKLGPAFLTLPPSFKPVVFPAIVKFIERVAPRIPLAIEFRHEDWFTHPGQEVFDRLRELNVTTVITDTAGRRDVCHMEVTNASVMVRFVGNNLVPSDYVRIQYWIDRMLYWFDSGVKDIYFFIHEPDKINAPALSTYLGKEWQKRSDIHTRYPEVLDNNQLNLFDQ